ncbi:hypothetical protein B0J12DRAFT_235450 [Macrophomina phaseolina]|uniref:Secreted protein n=1 Tax=Macrophomina phaseolina TaxID=35725 RepID=A0ABQ8GR13_9PEZI|nr:hypothetical protein B0J12DRAFT_235450 [Macrophomina phaseolina]
MRRCFFFHFCLGLPCSSAGGCSSNIPAEEKWVGSVLGVGTMSPPFPEADGERFLLRVPARAALIGGCLLPNSALTSARQSSTTASVKPLLCAKVFTASTRALLSSFPSLIRSVAYFIIPGLCNVFCRSGGRFSNIEVATGAGDGCATGSRRWAAGLRGVTGTGRGWVSEAKDSEEYEGRRPWYGMDGVSSFLRLFAGGLRIWVSGRAMRWVGRCNG